MSAASGSHEAVGIIGVVNNPSGNAGAMTFHTYNLGATIPEQMRITNTGDIGIATQIPEARLDVRDTGTATAPLRLETAGGAANTVRPQISMFSQGSNGYHISTIRSNVSNDPYGLAFVENTTERCRIDQNGHLHVGKQAFSISTTGHTFTRTGEATFTSSQSQAGQESVLYLNRQATDGAAIKFYRQNTNIGSIGVYASSTRYFTTSDRRLKTDIQPINDAINKVMAMNPVFHKWKADPEAAAVHGFIAQDMVEIVPEAVSENSDDKEMMAMDYGRITPVIVAALQDALKEIKSLRERVTQLEEEK